MKHVGILAAALLLAVPGMALAHGPKIGPRGGMQTHAGPLHAELFVEGQRITVHMYTMQAEEIPMDGATASATVLAGGKAERVELKPVGGNALKGTGSFPADAHDMKVVVSVTQAGKGTVSARFDLAQGH